MSSRGSSHLPQARGFRFWARTFLWALVHPFSNTNDNPGVQATLEDYKREVARITLEEVREALEQGYHAQRPSQMHPADYVTKAFELEGHEGLVWR